MEAWQILLLAVIGLVSGFLNVMAGGGSLITVPIMVFLGIPGPIANGTNRIAILAQNITAVLAFSRRGFSNLRLSLSLSLCALPGAVAGAWAGTRLDGVWFNRTLAVIMIAVMLLMAFEKKPARQDADPQAGTQARNLVAGHLLMVLVGAYGGFIQVGVGFLLMAVLHRVMGLNLVLVNMHKVFIVMSYSVAALLVFTTQVQIMWVVGACLAVGYSLGGYIAVHVSISKGERVIKIILNAVLVVFIIKLLFFN